VIDVYALNARFPKYPRDECIAELAAILEAADEVWVANGCGSPELWERSMTKLRALTAPRPTPPTKEE
jgi:hypothetical protein